MKSKTNIALVLLVAGLSSRYGGKIKGFAKVKKNQTLAEVSINQAIKSGVSKIIFVVGSKTKASFKKKFKRKYKGIPVFYAFQSYDAKTRDRPWGTADAICCALPVIDCPFIVCNGDDLYGKKTFSVLVKHLNKSQDEATVGYHLFNVLPKGGTVNRGIIAKKRGFVENIKDYYNINLENQKDNNLKKHSLCSMNIFALHKETLNFLAKNVANFKKNNSKDRRIECRLPHELSNLIKRKKIKIKIYNSIEPWLGITNPGDEKIIKKILEKKK